MKVRESDNVFDPLKKRKTQTTKKKLYFFFLKMDFICCTFLFVILYTVTPSILVVIY